MQLASYLCQPLYQIFLDLSKAYGTLDRDRTMSILEAYGVGPHVRSIICAVWDAELIIPKSGGYFGEPFHARRGVQQGDIISPVIFNIVVNAIVREWYACMNIGTVIEGTFGLGTTFYADDGRLSGTDPVRLQQGLTIVADLFKRMGLCLNTNKTKAMVYFGGAGSKRMSAEAYARCFDKFLLTQRQRAAEKVSCPQCNKRMNRQHLPLHQHEAHGLPLLHMPPIPDETTSQTYHVDFPLPLVSEIRIPCPVPDCPYPGATTHTKLQQHFRNVHEKCLLAQWERNILQQKLVELKLPA
jgi:hypothetical protein